MHTSMQPLAVSPLRKIPSPIPRRRFFQLFRQHTGTARSILGSRVGWNTVTFERRNRGKKALSVGCDLSSSNGAPTERLAKKRNIMEHIYLLRARPNLSDVEEKDMLDYLYTAQYQMGGILAISLGRIEDANVDSFTHAVYMRFQRKEDIVRFYANPYYSRILKEHVTPYSYGSISVDYESEVDDDILPIFRRGEDFNFGVECILLLSVDETALLQDIEDALANLQNLFIQFSSSIVQATQGYNLKLTDSEYTHAAVVRFPSFEAFKSFIESSNYKDMWSSRFQPIIRKYLLLHFAVDPVGTELM